MEVGGDEKGGMGGGGYAVALCHFMGSPLATFGSAGEAAQTTLTFASAFSP